MRRFCLSISRRRCASAGDARSSRVPSGRILLRKNRTSSVKSATSAESAATAGQPARMSEGGCSAICSHSSERSTTSSRSRISRVSSAAPSMRDLSSKRQTSSKPVKSKRAPVRRYSRISWVSCCWPSIHCRSDEAASCSTRACPSGDAAYPRTSWRSVSNSSTRALVWASGFGDIGFMLQQSSDRAIGSSGDRVIVESGN